MQNKNTQHRAMDCRFNIPNLLSAGDTSILRAVNWF